MSELHNKIVLKFRLKAYHPYYLNRFVIMIRTYLNKTHYLKVSCVSLPKTYERFTILRSPHVDKKSREHFEIKVYVKTISIFFNLNNFFEKQKAKLLIIFIKNSSSGFGLKIRFTI